MVNDKIHGTNIRFISNPKQKKFFKLTKNLNLLLFYILLRQIIFVKY